jgi:hypothetical protein
MDPATNNVARAVILVSEARRQEAVHLEHQKRYFSDVLAAEQSSIPPLSSVPRICACCSLPLHRTLDTRGRVENLLLVHYPKDHALSLANQLLTKYENREAQLIDELVQSFGPEPTEDSAAHRLECVSRKIAVLNAKWAKIMQAARTAASKEDYTNVIRHLSVMRIFLEGSQAGTYSCDPMERERRDVVHISNLQKLGLSRVC